MAIKYNIAVIVGHCTREARKNMKSNKREKG